MALIDVPAPMTGSIKEVLVVKGDTVRERQEILLIESMKMEIPIESPASGTVAEIIIAPGQRVEEGAVLLRLEALG